MEPVPWLHDGWFSWCGRMHRLASAVRGIPHKGPTRAGLAGTRTSSLLRTRWEGKQPDAPERVGCLQLFKVHNIRPVET